MRFNSAALPQTAQLAPQVTLSALKALIGFLHVLIRLMVVFVGLYTITQSGFDIDNFERCETCHLTFLLS